MKQRLVVIAVVALWMLAGCGGQETGQAPPKSEVGTDDTKKQAEQKASPFEGEHTNLADGDTATWNAGMAITVSDIHVAANETRRLAEENAERGSEGAKKSPSLNDPEELISFSYTITNEGQTPLNLSGQLPCDVLDANGVELKSGGLTAEQTPRLNPDYRPNNELLRQPLEQGQTRSGIESVEVPDSGAAELICVYPSQRGGEVNVGNIPEEGRATWVLDPATLPRRG